MSQGPVPPRPLTASEERNWALAAHIGSLVAAWFAMGFLCPLVIWLIHRDRSEFIRRHSLESLNFQISLLIYSAVAVILSVVTFGLGMFVVIPVGVVVAIAALVFIILATLAAADGRDYRYPLTIRLVR
ncbi:DUF4870 domain-containing protein [Kribbella deserti]|uniref:DUF4870 domain-containing protein n=1 Tax=Kribbella deserti TaxID=1926257 RepID=A0ABV6QK48_9ACTN